MLSGRKLLLADDSAAIRKVIELTFSDEGMEVTAVADGRAALEKLEQIAPDVVLADVFMPEIGGYEVCRLIKQNQRFGQIPVMLLVSSFDPFDEAAARSAGADDIVAKPFQSIRQLVSRVSSLLQDSEAVKKQPSDDYAIPGLPETESISSDEPPDEPNVTVLVEAPILETHEPTPPPAPSTAADVELQTADTIRLDQTSEDRHLDDTIEMEPEEIVQSAAEQHMNVEWIQRAQELARDSAPPLSAPVTDEPLLDIEDDMTGQQAADEVVLDLDFEDRHTVEALYESPVNRLTDVAASEVATSESVPAMQVPSISETQKPEVVADVATSARATTLETQELELSPAAIEAIAKRVVERMSDKAVRDIAWEVVPELAELLIKRKLEEKK